MTEELITLLCGQLENRRLRSPIPFQVIPAVQELETTIAAFPAKTRFIIFYYGQLDLSSRALLTSLSHQRNIDVIVTGDDSSNNLLNHRSHRLNLSEDLSIYKTVLCGIRAYRSMSEQSGISFENETKKLLIWLINNFRSKICHILLIPLNSSFENLITCQQALIEECESALQIREIRVCTIDDYVSADDFDWNNEDASTDISTPFMRTDKEMILDLIKHLAPIRLYLVGNESQITNDYSRSLIASERDVQQNSAEKYLNGCAFIEYELLGETIRRDLPTFLGTKWQIDESQITLKSVRELLLDRAFTSAIKRIDDMLSKRDIHGQIAMWEKILNYRENNSDESN